MDDDETIPPLSSPDLMPPVHDDLGLRHAWRALMGRLGFATHSVWLMFLTEQGRLTGLVMQIEDLNQPASDEDAELLVSHCAELLEGLPGCTFAVLLTRPGPARLNDWDRDWAAALVRAMRGHGCHAWPVHRANDEVLRVVAPDDLAGTGRLIPGDGAA